MAGYGCRGPCGLLGLFPRRGTLCTRARRGVRAAEGARLEIAYVLKGASRVQIPLSPLRLVRFPGERSVPPESHLPRVSRPEGCGRIRALWRSGRVAEGGALLRR